MDDFCGLKKGELIYLASPLGSEKVLREVRAARARDLTVALLLRGFQVYGPTAYGMALVKHDKRMEEFDWLGWNLFMLGFCTKLAVFQQDGWLTSPGVLKEIICALENDMPICYIPEIALNNLLTSMDQERLERQMVDPTVGTAGTYKGRGLPGELVPTTQEEVDADIKRRRKEREQQQVNEAMQEAMQQVYKDKPDIRRPE